MNNIAKSILLALSLLLSTVAQSNGDKPSRGNDNENKVSKSDDNYILVSCNPFPECVIWPDEAAKDQKFEKFFYKTKKKNYWNKKDNKYLNQ